MEVAETTKIIEIFNCKVYSVKESANRSNETKQAADSNPNLRLVQT